MEIKKFDLKIQEKVKDLISLATDMFPNIKSWYIEVNFWEDKDYRIELVHSLTSEKFNTSKINFLIQDKFTYRRVTNKYDYARVQKEITRTGQISLLSKILSKKDYTIEDIIKIRNSNYIEKKHTFVEKNQNGTWLIYCVEKEGVFSSGIWDKGYPYKKCPCCNEEIKFIRFRK